MPEFSIDKNTILWMQKYVVSAMRNGKLHDAEKAAKDVIAKYPAGNDYNNIAATILLGQIEYYEGDTNGGKELMEDGLNRAKNADTSSLTDDKDYYQIELATFNKIIKPAEWDLREIQTYMNSNVKYGRYWSHQSTPGYSNEDKEGEFYSAGYLFPFGMKLNVNYDISHLSWPDRVSQGVDKNTNVFFNATINDQNQIYKLLDVGPLRVLNVDLAYPIAIPGVGSLDLGAGYEWRILSMNYYNYFAVGPDGLTSYSPSLGRLDPENKSFDFNATGVKASLAYNSPNLFTIGGHSEHGMTTYFSAKYGLEVLNRPYDIYKAMDAQQLAAMKTKLGIMQGSANKIMNDPSNHENGDLNSPLLGSAQADYTKYQAQINVLQNGDSSTNTRGINDLQNELDNAKSENLESDTVDVSFNHSINDICGSPIKFSLVSFKFVVPDQIMKTDGIMPGAGSDQYLSWTPSLSWSPRILKYWIGNMFPGNKLDDDESFAMPLSVSYNLELTGLPKGTRNGHGLNAQAGLEFKLWNNMTGSATYGFTCSKDNDGGWYERHDINLGVRF